jgi:hypothetical protein
MGLTPQLVAAGEMHLPATHYKSLKLDTSIIFFLSERSHAKKNVMPKTFVRLVLTFSGNTGTQY